MISIKELSLETGIHTKTLQRWDRDGKLKAERSEKGRRMYNESAIGEALAIKGCSPVDIKGMSRVEHLMINPFDIPSEPDWKCNEGNVLRLMYLMESYGYTQSVFLWENGLRVIDGLHRAEAARRLDLRLVSADVYRGPETAFWSQRVNSAINHYTVTDERLSAFILETWLKSGMYVPVTRESILRDYKKFGYECDPNTITDTVLLKYSAARAIWETDFSTHRLGEENLKHKRNVDPQVKEWFESKAIMWNIPPIDLKKRLLKSLGFELGQSQRAQDIEAHLYLDAAISFAERVAIVKQATVHTSIPAPEVINWVEQTKSENNPRVSLRNYETEKKTVVKKLKKKVKPDPTKPVVVLSPQARLDQLERDRLLTFNRQVESIAASVRGLNAYLRMPTAAYNAAAQSLLSDLHKTLAVIPGWSPSEQDKVLLENMNLKSRLRVLIEKGVQVEENVVALSSLDMEVSPRIYDNESWFK